MKEEKALKLKWPETFYSISMTMDFNIFQG